jgi:prevent-host-death family protein
MSRTLTVTDAKARLSELVAAVAATHEHIEITRNGEPAAVLVSPAELAALRMAIAILSDPGAFPTLWRRRRTSPPATPLRPRTFVRRCRPVGRRRLGESGVDAAVHGPL